MRLVTFVDLGSTLRRYEGVSCTEALILNSMNQFVKAIISISSPTYSRFSRIKQCKFSLGLGSGS
jgi:hypothetical protein